MYVRIGIGKQTLFEMVNNPSKVSAKVLAVWLGTEDLCTIAGNDDNSKKATATCVGEEVGGV